MNLSPEPLSEAALLDRIRKDPRAAFPALIQANNQRLFRIARGILRDEGEAEEAVQETYVRAFASLDSFRGESSLGTWLSRILINEALKRQHRMKNAPAIDGPGAEAAADTSADLPSTPQANPENVAARNEIRRLVELAIDTLPPNFRVVFVMRIIEQMSIQETAEALGIPAETVKTRLHRATRRLRDELGAEFSSIFEDIFPFAGARCEAFTRSVLARICCHRSPSDAPDA
jgi:RNA polymerase sigma-70 factor (ECF subfamily)